MSIERQKLGKHGENLAENYLVKHEYTVIAKNWRCSIGELDLVVEKDEQIIFVEVRTRRGNHFGTPEASLTPRKQAKLVELAWTFLAEHDYEAYQWRIDVIAIMLNRQWKIERLNHIEWAIEA
ncbi:MAG: YraN family protein [Anaerolineaceae bacterium 4572_78]|nr:MAG: YraN family protein [Anaerolineaceae bacterium 4572_78]